jgi:glycosyltransferase involved in cell wall biosynthesis
MDRRKLLKNIREKYKIFANRKKFMKIVYCIPGTYNSGGMERVLAIKANYLAKQGYEIIIITTEQCNRPSFFEMDATIRCMDLDIRYEENNGKSIINKILKYPAKQIKHYKKLSKTLKELKADIVISMFGNETSFITKINDGSKKILEIHFSKFKRILYARKGLWRFADIWRSKSDEKKVRKFDTFIVLTKEDKGYWKNVPNIAVIPNPRTFDAQTTASLHNKKVIAVGRYAYQKGFEILIDIWHRVAQKINDWHLDIIGEGALLESYQEKINRMKLADQISLVKPTSRIAEMYLQSSVLAMTSRYEGLPMTLLEAQAFGLPTIAFDCKCGPKDIIHHEKNGFLIREGHLDDFADHLIRLMKDENLRIKMGREAFLNSANYSLEKIMQRWTTLFEELKK